MKGQVELVTRASPWERLLATNSTNSTAYSNTLRPDSLSEPFKNTTYPGLIEPKSLGWTQSNLKIQFFGTGADNATGTFYVAGISSIKGASALSWAWTLIAQFSITLSADVGIASGAVINTERYADTITLASAFNDAVDAHVVSPTGDIRGHAYLDLKGFEKCEVIARVGTATDLNCLVSLLP